MITAILILVGLAIVFGLILGYASVRFKVEGDPLVDQVDNLLPQTQCGQCSYAGCRPYAEAIANGEAPINKCPPGGESTILALADLLDIEPMELDEEAGVELDMPNVAVIIEKDCIGCTLCIQACPVDAIVGAAKLMHTVIEDECTGCDLCLPPCPVDCIVMVPRKTTTNNWKWQEPTPIEDALNDVLGANETTESFKTKIGSRTFFSAKYKMSEKNVFRATYFNNNNPYIDIKPSFGLGYNRELNKATYGVVASSGGNNGGFRLGANFAVQLGFLQLYTALDDLSNIGGKVQESNTANFRFGMNFLFGKINKSEVIMDEDMEEKEELLEKEK